MRESIVTAPLFNPDSEEEYPTDDVEMDNNESGTSYAENPIPEGNTTAGEVALFGPNYDNPLLKIKPLPWRAANTQERRNNTEMDTNESTGAGETVVLFRRNADNPLFKLGSKRPVEEEEEDRNRMAEERKNHIRVNVRAIRLCNNHVR